jgi:hypothetical protein
MTHAELEAHLQIIRAFIRNERQMRRKVFHNQPDKLGEKLAEIDGAVKAITEIVNALKATMPQQSILLNPPSQRSGGY